MRHQKTLLGICAALFFVVACNDPPAPEPVDCPEATCEVETARIAELVTERAQAVEYAATLEAELTGRTQELRVVIAELAAEMEEQQLLGDQVARLVAQHEQLRAELAAAEARAAAGIPAGLETLVELCTPPVLPADTECSIGWGRR